MKQEHSRLAQVEADRNEEHWRVASLPEGKTKAEAVETTATEAAKAHLATKAAAVEDKKREHAVEAATSSWDADAARLAQLTAAVRETGSAEAVIEALQRNLGTAKQPLMQQAARLVHSWFLHAIRDCSAGILVEIEECHMREEEMEAQLVEVEARLEDACVAGADRDPTNALEKLTEAMSDLRNEKDRTIHALQEELSEAESRGERRGLRLEVWS